MRYPSPQPSPVSALLRPRWRIAFYSHDTMGLGHMRRNLLIARTLAGAGLRVSVLLIAGAREASLFALPPGVDMLTLPALRKEPDGRYAARSLGLSLAGMHALRAHAIQAALSTFDPHVLIVDNVPRGADGELTPTLQMLRARSTRLVLGLRDILDDPAAVGREWSAARNEQAIRDFYHAVWVYGDPAVYDLVREYHLAADVAARVSFTGYLDRRGATAASAGEEDPQSGETPPGPYVLCTVGGGEDGAALAQAFVQAALPAGTRGVLLTGPFMAAEVRAGLRRRLDGRPDLSLVEFSSEPLSLLAGAEAVVAMGGYNTVSELLSYEKPALIVPRVYPRREQAIRAACLSALGLVDWLPPEALTAERLSQWIAAARPPQPARARIDLRGLERLPRLLEDLLPSSPSGSRSDAARRRSLRATG